MFSVFVSSSISISLSGAVCLEFCIYGPVKYMIVIQSSSPREEGHGIHYGAIIIESFVLLSNPIPCP